MSAVRRFCLPNAAPQGSTLRVRQPETVHYVTRVLRLRPGDGVECFDGRGRVYEGRIGRVDREGFVIEVERCHAPQEIRAQVTLVQALIKGERFEWLIQKATELGVARIVPLITQRTVVRPAAAGAQQKRARWERIAREAATQCGRAHVPDITSPARFTDVLPLVTTSALTLIATLAVDTRPLREVLERQGRFGNAIVMIGPEGDFTPGEAAMAQDRGAHPVSLGPLTLRAETAGIAALSILQYAVGAL